MRTIYKYVSFSGAKSICIDEKIKFSTPSILNDDQEIDTGRLVRAMNHASVEACARSLAIDVIYGRENLHTINTSNDIQLRNARDALRSLGMNGKEVQNLLDRICQSIHESIDHRLEDAIASQRDNARICSMTESWDMENMWENYGCDNNVENCRVGHDGVAVGFSSRISISSMGEELFLEAKPVKYVDTIPSIITPLMCARFLLNIEDINWDAIAESIRMMPFVKESGWSGEREHRFVISDCHSVSKETYFDISKNCVSELVFGYQACRDRVENLVASLDKDLWRNKVYQCVHPRKWQNGKIARVPIQI